MLSVLRKTTRIGTLALIGAVFVVSAGTEASAAGSTIYVDRGNPSCSDANSGDITQPLCTISAAAAIATAGQNVVVNPGTYNESVTVGHSGSSGSPIVFSASGAVVVSGGAHGFTVSAKSYITITGFTVTQTTSYGIYATGGDHVTISGNHVTYSGLPQQSSTAPGIYVRNTNASIVSGNTADHNSDNGINVTGTSTGVTVSGNLAFNNAQGWQRAATGINIQAPGNTVIGNISHDNEDTGIQLYPGGDNNLVVNNVVYNNGDHGVDSLNVTGDSIIGNTVFHNCTSGINVEGTSTNFVVENNVAVDNAVYPAYNGISCSRATGNIRVANSAPASTTADYNMVWLTKAGTEYVWNSSYSSLAAMKAATGQEAHGIQADPKFVNPSDLHLAGGSPAIDSADSGAPGQQASDLEGNPRVDDPATPNTGAGPRTYDDRGAYEFQGSSPPPPDNPPVAALTLTPSSGYAPLGVTADASGSTDTDLTPISSYTFNFGDGTIVGPQGGATAQHTYNVVGNYTVTVTVADSGGLSGTATKTATVQKALTAALSVTPPSGYAPLGVTADGSNSAGQNPISTYTFNFGDGTTVGPQPGPTATHTYTLAGTYTAVLTVKDSLGNTATAQQSVTAKPDLPPSAAVSVTPSSGKAPLQVTANASASTDGDLTPIATYTFNFGDGTIVGPQASAQASHTYPGAGTFTVTATVTDTAKQSSTATATVSVADSAPSASLSMTSNSGTAPFATVADASGSTDPDTTPIATYTFDFGDGTVVGPQGASTAPHTFQQPGVYTVKVTVKDTANLSSTATATVTVSSANLVGNPGFETNTAGWAPLPSSSGITLTQVAGGHSGTSAALIQNTSGNKKQTCGLNDSPNWVKTTSAGFYVGQIWVRADQPGTSFKLVLTEYSGSSNVGSASKSLTLTTSWQLVTVKYTIKQPGSTLDFNGSTTQKGGNCFYADDISITFV